MTAEEYGQTWDAGASRAAATCSGAEGDPSCRAQLEIPAAGTAGAHPLQEAAQGTEVFLGLP